MREHVQRVHQIIGEKLAMSASARFRDSLQAVFDDRMASDARGIPWFMLPIFTCEALGGDIEPAHHVAAGFEIGRMAAGCLDEWQDHDTEDALWKAIGPEQTINLATGMIALSLLTVARVGDLGVRPELVLGLQREFELTLLCMSEGQHADLSDDLTLDEYDTVAEAKSGALFRLGCRAGAMVAGAPLDAVECYGDFGQNLGMLAQVWNDIGGLAGVLGKNDAEQRRALPVLAAMAMDQTQQRSRYEQQSAEGQAGQLYALLQLGLLHQRTSEALAKCPAAGHLTGFLKEYDPGRLAEMIEQSSSQQGESHEE